MNSSQFFAFEFFEALESFHLGEHLISVDVFSGFNLTLDQLNVRLAHLKSHVGLKHLDEALHPQFPDEHAVLLSIVGETTVQVDLRRLQKRLHQALDGPHALNTLAVGLLGALDLCVDFGLLQFFLELLEEFLLLLHDVALVATLALLACFDLDACDLFLALAFHELAHILGDLAGLEIEILGEFCCLLRHFLQD